MRLLLILLVVLVLIPVLYFLVLNQFCGKVLSQRVFVDCCDVCPGTYLVYCVNGCGSLVVNFTEFSSVEYPVVRFCIKYLINDVHGCTCGSLVLRGRFCVLDNGSICWFRFPLFIPKGLVVGDVVHLYYNSCFRVVDVRYILLSLCDGRSLYLKCFIVSNGSDTLVYDCFSGVLVEGLLRFCGLRFFVKLCGTNLCWRFKLYDLYVDWYELYSFAHYVNSCFRDFVRVCCIGESVLGRDLFVFEVNPRGKCCIMVVGCVHGTEVITANACLYLIERFIEQRDLLIEGNVCLAVVPVLNPDGVEFGKCVPDDLYVVYARRNALGVDLNKNFPYGIPPYPSEPEPASLRYPGIYRRPVPEVKALMQYLLKIHRRLLLYVELHSGADEKLVLYPSGVPELDHVVTDLVNSLRAHVLREYDVCATAPSGQGYWWVYGRLRKLAILLEVYSGASGESRFNPLCEDEVDAVCREVYNAIKFLILRLGMSYVS